MNDEELRLKCIEIAKTILGDFCGVDRVVELAQKIYDFVKGK